MGKEIMSRKSYEVEISPAIIKWTRESAGWSIKEIANILKTSRENYQKLESAEKRTTFKQLEILSKYFKRTLATFFLPEPSEEASITSYFRILPKNESELSRELRLAIRKARYYQTIVDELKMDLGLDFKPKITTLTIQDDPPYGYIF